MEIPKTVQEAFRTPNMKSKQFPTTHNNKKH